ncbi:ferredoxin--NADP reductase [Nocardia jiangxiensis]|uniref:2Fe-2S iron-sulfur cluster-binding protein n=1 Tax=Nocardia jiangxiensis TaxID=282685 RepID=A0ABW6S9M7_9NOCA|nr:ferredoxin--NADP reductase [Nocardia jiangxiensis]
MTQILQEQLGHLVGVREVIDETADAKTIVLEIPHTLREKFSYRPGQFLTVRIPSDTVGGVGRCYSLASSPDVDDHLCVTVKRTAGGYGSNWLCDNVVAGDQLRVLAPTGTFTPSDITADLVLFAAGSGITPVMSILKSALAQSDSHIALFYANRDAASVIFDAELRRLAQQHPDRLAVAYWLEAERGMPDQAGLAGFAGAFSGRDAFLCGPAPFMDLTRRVLRSVGFDARDVHAEEFVSLSGDPFVPTVQADSGGAVATAVVRLDGRTHTVNWPTSANLIDVLLAEGIDAPFSCRSGECGSCTATLAAGLVEMENSDALDPDDVADGYILACQARPVSPSVEIEF